MNAKVVVLGMAFVNNWAVGKEKVDNGFWVSVRGVILQIYIKFIVQAWLENG